MTAHCRQKKKKKDGYERNAIDPSSLLRVVFAGIGDNHERSLGVSIFVHGGGIYWKFVLGAWARRYGIVGSG